MTSVPMPLAFLMLVAVSTLTAQSPPVSKAPLATGDSRTAGAQLESWDRLAASDRFAIVDGQPLFVGELNLILARRFADFDWGQPANQVQRAIAVVLVRRHLAMNSLKQIGGQPLQVVIDQEIAVATKKLRRRGSSLAKYATSRKADRASLVAEMSWNIAWSRYLKNRLNQQTLQRYFETHQPKYGATFVELTDQSSLRRDLASALFDRLVRNQSEATIEWSIPQLQPPQGTTVIP